MIVRFQKLSAITLAIAVCFAGCGGKSESGKTGAGQGTKGSPLANGSGGTPTESMEGWPEQPDIPMVPIMTDIDGIEIPRIKTSTEKMALKGKVPADVGNEHAKAYKGKPVTGGRLSIRFNSEPKTMNPITESSAVQQYIAEYVQEALASQDPESLKYEPSLATEWVKEDAVILSPDYKGKERRVATADGKPATELELTYEAGLDEDDPAKKPATIALKTSDGEGKPLGNVWVGLFPAGDIPGAPKTGYHLWSDAKGNVEVSSIKDGKYAVKVGAEIYGETYEGEAGELKVMPASAGNPLADHLKETGEKSLLLKKSDWVDIQRQVYVTYTLDKEAKWSDGKPFTTKDILFGHSVIRNPLVDGEDLRTYYEDLIVCDAIDDHTLRTRYRQQYFKSFEFSMGLAMYSPPWHKFAEYFKADGFTLTQERLTEAEEDAQKKRSVHGQRFAKFFNTDDRYNRQPLGTGPYVIKGWETGNSLTLERNENYWGTKRRGYLDRIIVKFVPDSVTAFGQFKAGELDFLWVMLPEQYFEALSPEPDWFKGEYVKADWFSPGFRYLGWNSLDPLFQDRRVRIAMSMMFDRVNFLNEKMHGAGMIVTGSQYFFGPGYDHDVKPIAYDPDTARDLLAEAGWIDTNNDGVLDKDGKDFKFELWMPSGNKIYEETATLFKFELKKVKINMEVRSNEWAAFLDKVKKRTFPAMALGWAQPLESDPFQIWHGSEAGPTKRGSNHVSFDNPTANELIERIRVTLDPERRKLMNYSLHRILDREQPYSFLYLPKDLGAYHKRYHGVKWYKLRPGFDLAEWYVPKDQQRK